MVTKRILRAVLTAFVLLTNTAAFAAGSGQETKAARAIIVDFDSAAVLFEKEADARFAPASLAKLMTAEYLLHELKEGHLLEDDTFCITTNAWTRGGAPSGVSSMFVELNSRVEIRSLLRGLVVQGGTDAAIAIAEGIAQSESAFVDRVNQRAVDLRMTGSQFRNVTAASDPEQVVTARDLAVLAQYIIRTYPDYYPVFAEREFTWNSIKQSNRNRLVASASGVDGLGVGFSPESGYGAVISAKRDGRRLVLVLSGLESPDARDAEALKLLDWGFGQPVGAVAASPTSDEAIEGRPVPTFKVDSNGVAVAAGEAAPLGAVAASPTADEAIEGRPVQTFTVDPEGVAVAAGEATPLDAETAPAEKAMDPAEKAGAVAHAGRRVALIIGNSDYGAVSKLPNPGRDADALAAALKRIAFDVVVLSENLDNSGMRRALGELSELVADADWAVVYFAGHGIEVDGENYLIPIDARLRRDKDVAFEAIPLASVVAAVEGAKTLSLVIIDACRDNPFAAQMQRTARFRAVTRGLARPDTVASGATVIAYAAGAGEVAEDGSETNSPYVTSLLKHLEKPGLEIGRVFRNVRADVLKLTDGRQEPATYGEFPPDDLFFLAAQ